MRIHAILLLSVLALLACVRPAHAAESYANCTGTIIGIGQTISAPGTWCLKQDISTQATTGTAITIAADNVVIDCNYFYMRGPAGANDTSIGIASTNHFHVTVRHCIMWGFRQGLNFTATTAGPYGGYVVEDNLFEANTLTGIHVEGDGSVVRRNLVLNTGGANSTSDVQGIATIGSVSVSGNTVSFVNGATGDKAYGIYTSNDSGGSIDHNQVHQVAASGGQVWGIYSAGQGQMSIGDNDLLDDPSFATLTSGLVCETAPGSGKSNTSARAARNIIAGFSTGFHGCGTGGLNDISP